MAEEKQENQEVQETAPVPPAPPTEERADTLEEVPDMSEFEGKAPAPGDNKDLWLFLIILDVIALCTFGFFLYKNISAKLLATSATQPVLTVQEEFLEIEEPLVDEKMTDTPVMMQEPVAVETVAEVISVPEPVAQPEEPAAVAAQSTPAKPTEKKQSVVVKTNPKSKYRQVTFRYFDKADTVAIVSGFTMTKPRAMTQKNGVWETTLSILPGTYKYLFVVDGKQRTDPYAPEKDGRSVLVLK